MSIKRVPKWIWWVAAALIALHIYFFQQLIAAELIFALMFGGLLLMLIAIYLLSEAGDRGIEWVEANRHELAQRARQQWGRVGAISKKTFHHQHS